MNQTGSWRGLWWRLQVWGVAIVMLIAFASSPVAMIRLTGDIAQALWWIGSNLGDGIDNAYDGADDVELEEVERLERQADLAERRDAAEERLAETGDPDDIFDPDGDGSETGGAALDANGGVGCTVRVWLCCPDVEVDLANLPDCLAIAFPPAAAWDRANDVHDTVVAHLPESGPAGGAS